MLLFPIFLLLLCSATILAPSPHLIIGFIRTATLQSSTWSALPTTVPSSVPRSPLETITRLPVLVPRVFLDAPLATCGPSPTHEAISNTIIPYSSIHSTDLRAFDIAVLLVVLLVIFNCLVYKSLLEDPKHSRAEAMSEQLVVFPASTHAASLSQEPICRHAPVGDGTPSPFLSVDPEKSVSDSLEQEEPTLAVMRPLLSSYEITVLSQPSTPFGQSLNVLSRDFSLDNSEKTTNGDSSLTTSSPSDSALFDYPSVSVIPSPEFKVPRAVLVASSIEIDDMEPMSPNNTPLVSEATKEDTPTQADPSNVAHFPKLEPKSSLPDNPMSPPSIEDALNFDVDVEGLSCYQTPESECDNDETFDYRGVDWIPHTPASETQARLSGLHHPLGSHHDHSLEPFLSPLAKSAARACDAGYAWDDIQVGVKDQKESEATSITRCTSFNDFSGFLENTQVTHALTISDDRTAMLQRDILSNDTPLPAHRQVTLLRADAPIFKPRNSGKDEEDWRLHSGLKTSIHAPKDEEILQNESHVEVSELTRAIGQECTPVTIPAIAPDSPGSSIENGGFQTSLDAAEEPRFSESAQLPKSISPLVPSGIHASIHAPRSIVDQELDENLERLTTQPSLSTAPSSLTDNRMQIGLAGSIHAPGARIPHQAIKGSPKHTADAPNWAAAARVAEVSSNASKGSAPAQSRNASNTVTALDKDDSELPTSMRCAAKDREEEDGSIDNSDGSSDHADDPEDTTGTDETDNGLDEVDDEQPNDQDSDTRCRRTRRRGKPRRRRQKAPYVPPPRMRNLTQHPVVDLLTAPAHAQAPTNAFVPPSAASNGQYYTHARPPPLHHPTSAPGHVVPPHAIPNHLGQHPHYRHSGHLGFPQTGTRYPSHAPGFQPPGPYNPMFYSHIPHAQNFSPQAQAPFIPVYGR